MANLVSLLDFNQLMISLTLRCDTTRVLGLQSETRLFDGEYNANHLLYFHYNSVYFNDMKSSPWVAVDPPGPVRELNKAG